MKSSSRKITKTVKKRFLTVEYLVIVEKGASPALFGLCDSIKTFNKFLQTNETIEFCGAKAIRLRNSQDTFDYHVEMGEVKNVEQRFFHVKISTDKTALLDSFVRLTRAIKQVVMGGRGQIETLWDDVSLHYSELAYPYIHRIENLMRKLITYFMLTTVGKEWVNMTSPEVVKRQIDGKQKQYIDALFQVDFIQLGDFLFKAYTTKDIQELYNIVENQESIEELSVDDVLAYKARSNWDRYFSNFVDCEAAYLKKRWSQLYELRCDVAHNKLFSRANLQDVVRLYNDVEPYLIKALSSTSAVEVSNEDKEQIAESVASSLSSIYSEFLDKWKTFETSLRKAVANSNVETQSNDLTILESINILIGDGSLDEGLAETIQTLANLRNKIVHGIGENISELEVNEGSTIVDTVLEQLPTYEQPVSFHSDCILRIERHLNTNLEKKSRTTYQSESELLRITCSVSKLHEKKYTAYYWFGFHQRQNDFLSAVDNSYATFGCGSANVLFAIPFSKLVEYLKQCNTTKAPRFYWHLQITPKENEFYLHQKNGEHIALTPYLIETKHLAK